MKKYLLLPFLMGILIAMVGCGRSAANIYLKRGKDYYHKNNYQMAIRFFNKTLEVDSTLTEARYYTALCYYGLGHNHHACEEMVKLKHEGYAPADTTLQSMGCFYFPADTVQKKIKK